MSLHIEARRWFQRTHGNTYHSVTIHGAGEPIRVDFAYGYGDQWAQTALDALRAAGRAPDDGQHGTTRYLRETLGATYSVADVARQKDL
jgi:hypothetical protein